MNTARSTHSPVTCRFARGSEKVFRKGVEPGLFSTVNIPTFGVRQTTPLWARHQVGIIYDDDLSAAPLLHHFLKPFDEELKVFALVYTGDCYRDFEAFCVGRRVFMRTKGKDGTKVGSRPTTPSQRAIALICRSEGRVQEKSRILAKWKEELSLAA
jgi:hypothetical protein